MLGDNRVWAVKCEEEERRVEEQKRSEYKDDESNGRCKVESACATGLAGGATSRDAESWRGAALSTHLCTTTPHSTDQRQPNTYTQPSTRPPFCKPPPTTVCTLPTAPCCCCLPWCCSSASSCSSLLASTPSPELVQRTPRNYGERRI
jgi:hypothetical protein